MSRNVLTIGDLEPERPTVTINRTAPDGRWQAWKFRHLDVLLRWFPVRFAQHTDVFPMRLPSEFGLRHHQRINAMTREVRELDGDTSPEAARRMAKVLRNLSGMILDAPASVLDDLTPQQHLRILLVFPAAVTGQIPTTPEPENPPTSDASFPDSTASTAAGTG